MVVGELAAEVRTLGVRACLGLAPFLLLVCSSSAQVRADSQSAPPTSNLALLVSDTVRNEVRDWKTPPAYFEYEEVDWSPEETTVSREIETPEGVFGRLITLNGAPPSPKRLQKQAQRLRKFAADPTARDAMVRGEREDDERRMELLQEFPNAFFFELDGPVTSGVIRLKFHPNPNFRPASHNALALRGAEGTIWIDESSERLIKIEGTLIRDVTLGWGVVVRLHRGGQFAWEQSQVSPGIWELTQLSVNLRGKIFLVKTLDLQMKETHRSFKRVPSNLTTAQAVAMLVKQNAGLEASANRSGAN